MTLYSKLKRKARELVADWTTEISKVLFHPDGIQYGKNLHVREIAKVYNEGTIEIVDRVRINSALWANPISASTSTCFQVSGGKSGMKREFQI